MLNTQRFLKYAGLTFLALAALGYLALGPSASNSLFNNYLYFDMGQNLAHIVLGGLALLAWKFTTTDRWLRIISGAIGVGLLVVSVLAMLNLNTEAPNLGLINMGLVSAVIHLVIALVAFWVAFMPEGPVFVNSNTASDTAEA